MRMEPIQTHRTVIPSKATALGRFKGFKPESENASRKVEVKRDGVMSQLQDAWEKTLSIKQGIQILYYEEVLSIVRELKYSAKDVEAFSIFLMESEDDGTSRYGGGMFLSALVNNGEEGEYTVHAGYCEWPPTCLGYKNTKKLIIDGNAGSGLANLMEGGSITVKGDATHFSIAGDMTGGEIFVEGELDMIPGGLISGRIYHKGKLVFEKVNGVGD